MAGQVSGLVVQRRNPNRVSVYLDGEYAFGLHRITAAWLRVGQQLEADQIDDLKQKDLSEVIYQSALRLLNYRQRTAVEMTNRLLKKGYESDQVREVVDRLLQNHLLDDQQFAEDWVRDRKAFHPRSKRLMAYEMMNKGLDREIVQTVLVNAGDESLLAEAAARRSMRKWSGMEEMEFITHCAAFLGRKGFAAGISFSTARTIWKELRQEMEQ